MKPCNTCGLSKPLDDYYKHPRGTDGRSNKCKDCTKRAVRINYRENRDHYQAYERQRAKDPARKAKALDYQRTRRSKSRERSWARGKVAFAVRTGRLVPMPCEVCGSGEVQAHHEDYSKPLDVMWLCFPHHRARHGQVAEATDGVRSFTVSAPAQVATPAQNDNGEKESA